MTKTDEHGNKTKKGTRIGRSRTLVLPTLRAASRVRFREKEVNDDRGSQDSRPTTPRSSELKWMREVKSERFNGGLSNNQRSSFSSLSPSLTPGSYSSASPSGSVITPGVVSRNRSGNRNSSLQIASSSSGNKGERQPSGRMRERRSMSLVAREPRRRRSSSMLASIHMPHISSKGVMLQESTSSSRDSDGSRGRPSSFHELGRSASDRSKMRHSHGIKREGTMIRSPVRSPLRSPLTDRSRMMNLELAMALPEEETIEHMLKLKSDCSGSDAETMSMKGIVSSLIAIENEEL